MNRLRGYHRPSFLENQKVQPRLSLVIDEPDRKRERKQTAIVVTLICLGAFALVELAMLAGGL